MIIQTPVTSSRMMCMFSLLIGGIEEKKNVNSDIRSSICQIQGSAEGGWLLCVSGPTHILNAILTRKSDFMPCSPEVAHPGQAGALGSDRLSRSQTVQTQVCSRKVEELEPHRRVVEARGFARGSVQGFGRGVVGPAATHTLLGSRCVRHP